MSHLIFALGGEADPQQGAPVMREPMRASEDVRRAPWVAYLLLVGGAVCVLIATFTGSEYTWPPAVVASLAGGLWLGRPEEADARRRSHVGGA